MYTIEDKIDIGSTFWFGEIDGFKTGDFVGCFFHLLSVEGHRGVQRLTLLEASLPLTAG